MKSLEKILMLDSPECLCKSVSNHFFCRLVHELNHVFVNLFAQEVKLDVDVLRPCVINRILASAMHP